MAKLIQIQMFIYLLFAPALNYALVGNLSYSYLPGIFFMVAFSLGWILSRRINKNETVYFVKIPMLAKFGFLLLSVFYIFLILKYNLLLRRQGSEMMAFIFATIPFFHLLVLRLFEILFIPFMLLMGYKILFNIKFNDKRRYSLFIFFMFIAFLFSGVIDSRARLMWPFVYAYVFLNLDFSSLLKKSKLVVVALLLLLGVGGALISYLRLGDTRSFKDVFVGDFIQRLNGIELVSNLEEQLVIPFFGTLDYKIFANYVAAVPFLQGASSLKELGLTSSKNYILHVILGSSQFDINNSMITDLYYFGGVCLVCVMAFLFGMSVGKFDNKVRNGYIFRHRFNFSLGLAFLIHASKFEMDFFSIPINVVRDTVIVYLFLLISGIKFKKMIRSPHIEGPGSSEPQAGLV